MSGQSPCVLLTLGIYIFSICLKIYASPVTTSIPYTTKGNVSERSTESPPSPQLYVARVEQLEVSLNDSFASSSTTPPAVSSESTPYDLVNGTDDLLVTSKNTLDDADEIFGHNEQHESSTSTKNDDSQPQSYDKGMWHRMKQSIPVLEPVRHLLNTVRDQHNQTVHAAKQFHQVLSTMKGNHMPSNESSAIETEEDRETAIESTEFNVLDFVGSIVSMVWSFIGNLQRASAASSGNEDR